MSWIVVSKATGKAVLETFSATLAKAINRDAYDVLEAGVYLGQLNARIRGAA